MRFPREWEKINKQTDRLKVYGGWLVRTYVTLQEAGTASVAITFYKDKKYEWQLEKEK